MFISKFWAKKLIRFYFTQGYYSNAANSNKSTGTLCSWPTSTSFLDEWIFIIIGCFHERFVYFRSAVCLLPVQQEVSCLFSSGLTGSQLFLYIFVSFLFTFFSGGMIDQFGSLSRASIQRGAFEELQRPAPPPYSSISRLNPTEEDEGTYLV